MTTENFINAAFTGYVFKLIIAILLTPLIYLGHSLINKYLAKEEAYEIIHKSAEGP